MRSVETDYLVVGAGAMGMAFTDALIDHADVHVTLVDRRHAAGGHWLDAYPFVRLHQASLFYGVASTVLGSGAVQPGGPETGLQERAGQSEIQAYFDDILHRRFLGSGRVTFLGESEYHAEGSSHLVTSRVSGETVQVHVRRRVVDATYLSPTIPATTPPPFNVADDVHVVAINELARLTAAPNSYVIVGSGKTATDGIVWLLANGVPPDRIVWVRPRDPWMLNRAVVQPDPVVGLGLAADTMEAAASAESLDDLFLRLEAAGVMLRIDRDVIPTMAKTPTLAAWELDLLRTIDECCSSRTHQARDIVAKSSSTRALSRWRRARSSCTAPPPDCSTHRSFPSGARIRSDSRRSGSASRASARLWPATWKQPATTTGSATDCVRRTPYPTRLSAGRGCRCVEPSRRAPTALSRTSPPGRTAAP